MIFYFIFLLNHQSSFVFILRYSFLHLSFNILCSFVFFVKDKLIFITFTNIFEMQSSFLNMYSWLFTINKWNNNNNNNNNDNKNNNRWDRISWLSSINIWIIFQGLKAFKWHSIKIFSHVVFFSQIALTCMLLMLSLPS